jgi:chromosome segregation ATPase
VQTTIANIAGDESRCSSDVAAATQAAEQELEGARAKLARLEAERRRLLVEGTDAEVTKQDAAISGARRQAERLEAALQRLREQLLEARGRESVAALTDRIAGAREGLERGKELIREYGVAAARIAEILAELKAIDSNIVDVARAASAAGRAEEVVGLTTANRALRGNRAPLWEAISELGRVQQEVRLPRADARPGTLWPVAR